MLKVFIVWSGRSFPVSKMMISEVKNMLYVKHNILCKAWHQCINRFMEKQWFKWVGIAVGYKTWTTSKPG